MEKILIRPGTPGEKLASAENSGTCYRNLPARGQTLRPGQVIALGPDGFEYPADRVNVTRYLVDTDTHVLKHGRRWSVFVPAS